MFIDQLLHNSFGIDKTSLCGQWKKWLDCADMVGRLESLLGMLGGKSSKWVNPLSPIVLRMAKTQ